LENILIVKIILHIQYMQYYLVSEIKQNDVKTTNTDSDKNITIPTYQNQEQVLI